MIRDKLKNRDIQNIDDDVIRAKRIIRAKLCEDEDIIEALHNVELEKNEAPPDEYFGVNIYSLIRVPGIQDTVKNFICFSVDDIEDLDYNNALKMQVVQFVIFCHEDDIVTEYGIDRHDLLGYLIRDIFNWSNMLGLQLKLIYNRESVTDTNYYVRTIKFEAVQPNSLQKGVMNNRYEFNTYRRS